MSNPVRSTFAVLAAFALITLATVSVFVWSGMYDIGADSAHTRPVLATLDALRARSIARHALSIEVPVNLSEPARIRAGAGNYAAMCAGCHLAPGVADSELHRGLYPAPPVLARRRVGNPREQFWIVKHGVKASGMPAWGRSMDDESLWGVVAFLQQLPRMDASDYESLVQSSGGHSHGKAGTVHAAAGNMEEMEGMAARHDMATPSHAEEHGSAHHEHGHEDDNADPAERPPGDRH